MYGFYGGNDARINASIPATKEQMKALGKTYEPVIYEGAGHGFLRAGEEPGATEANRKAMPKADFSKWAKPQDIARVILFLCSDDAKVIHGAAIPVYGDS